MREDAKRRRLKIIDAACDLLRAQPHTVPLELVAARAGVGVATLYRNFPDKSSLLHACGAAIFTKTIALQKNVLSRFDTDPLGQWHHYVNALVEMGLGALVSTFAPEDLDSLPSDVRDLRATAAQLGSAIVDKCRQAGFISAEVTHQRFLTGLVTITRPPVEGIRKLEPNLEKWLVKVYLKGL